jgi:UDP:flavonoid glycosyltransferase YjiC (YdhE family)
MKNILFMSGSIGLGHITRDLAIARELRRQRADVRISWLAASPADEVLAEAGERLCPEAGELIDENTIAESRAEGPKLNLIKYAAGVRGQWSRNLDVLDRTTRGREFDLLIGDKTYEVVLAFRKHPNRKPCPFVMIYDFVGFEPMSRNPLERLGAYLWNMKWAKAYKRTHDYVDMSLFIGDEHDVPDEKFGFLLPNRRDWAKTLCKFVGYIPPFDPEQYTDTQEVRSRLGYDSSPTVICAIGGTAIGKSLLELCGRAFPIAREIIKDLRMVLVCGPRLAEDSLDVPEGVEVRGYVPHLHEHLAASDLAIVQGGGTVTLELTALLRPFIFFPIEGHSEQEVHVANRLARHGAGIKMIQSQTDPSLLADAIVRNIGKRVSYPPIPVDGARIAAELIAGLLSRCYRDAQQA